MKILIFILFLTASINLFAKSFEEIIHGAKIKCHGGLSQTFNNMALNKTAWRIFSQKFCFNKCDQQSLSEWNNLMNSSYKHQRSERYYKNFGRDKFCGVKKLELMPQKDYFKLTYECEDGSYVQRENDCKPLCLYKYYDTDQPQCLVKNIIKTRLNQPLKIICYDGFTATNTLSDCDSRCDTLKINTTFDNKYPGKRVTIPGRGDALLDKAWSRELVIEMGALRKKYCGVKAILEL